MFLQRRLTELHPQDAFELFGFDVHDEGVQTAGFIKKTVDALHVAHPDVDWKQRIFSIHSAEAWPLAAG